VAIQCPGTFAVLLSRVSPPQTAHTHDGEASNVTDELLEKLRTIAANLRAAEQNRNKTHDPDPWYAHAYSSPAALLAAILDANGEFESGA
jgi:hypothetical protein